MGKRVKMEQENALLSIVVPVYNSEQYLKRCIDSIINQTYHNLDIILVDDGSSDESGEICDEYAKVDKRIRVIHKQNGGQSDARCKGIELAEGTYLGFVDSDDWIESSMYENLLKDAWKYDMITSGIQRHNTEDKPTTVLRDALPAGVYVTEEEMAYFYDNLMICQYRTDSRFVEGLLHSKCSKLFKMSIVREMYRSANISVTNGEDWLFCILYVLKCTSVKIIHECYYHYMHNADSICNHVNFNFLKESNAFYLTVCEALKNHWKEKSLIVQFQKWFFYRVIVLMPQFLQFHEEINLIRYICPYFERLKGKKLVLFGAGKVGNDYYKEFLMNELDVVLWVDNYHYDVQRCGMDIVSPDMICNIEYDYILCALFSRTKVDEIREQLINLGISEEKILWEQPYDLVEGLKKIV